MVSEDRITRCTRLEHPRECAECETFVCSRCEKRVTWADGADDEGPTLCSSCWHRAYGDAPESTRDFVCFSSAFRQNGSRGGVESPNITHAALDGQRTLCGRSGWATSVGWSSGPPDCLRCAHSYERRFGTT